MMVLVVFGDLFIVKFVFDYFLNVDSIVVFAVVVNVVVVAAAFVAVVLAAAVVVASIVVVIVVGLHKALDFIRNCQIPSFFIL